MARPTKNLTHAQTGLPAVEVKKRLRTLGQAFESDIAICPEPSTTIRKSRHKNQFHMLTDVNLNAWQQSGKTLPQHTLMYFEQAQRPQISVVSDLLQQDCQYILHGSQIFPEHLSALQSILSASVRGDSSPSSLAWGEWSADAQVTDTSSLNAFVAKQCAMLQLTRASERAMIRAANAIDGLLNKSDQESIQKAHCRSDGNVINITLEIKGHFDSIVNSVWNSTIKEVGIVTIVGNGTDSVLIGLQQHMRSTATDCLPVIIIAKNIAQTASSVTQKAS
jgi:hypothetical protein